MVLGVVTDNFRVVLTTPLPLTPSSRAELRSALGVFSANQRFAFALDAFEKRNKKDAHRSSLNHKKFKVREIFVYEKMLDPIFLRVAPLFV